MLKEQKSLINLSLEKETIFVSKILKLIFDGLYELYGNILEDPFENFWFECVGIIIEYIQLLLYLCDKTVNNLLLIFIHNILVIKYSSGQFGTIIEQK